MEKRPRPTTTYRWWLRLQLGLLLAGGVVWLVGAALGEDFVTGAGVGMLVGALVLRIGRRAARDSPHREEGDGLHRRTGETAPGAEVPAAPDARPVAETGEEGP